jgi:hypothetical protein
MTAATPRRGARLFWYAAAAVFLGIAVAGLIAGSIHYQRAGARFLLVDGRTELGDRVASEVIAPLSCGFAALGLAGLALFRARLRGRLPFWHRTAGPFLLAASLSTFLGAITIQAILHLDGDALAGAGIATIVSGLLSAILASNLIGAARRRARERAGPALREAQSGWAALGTLFVVAALALALAGTVVATGPGRELLRQAELEVPRDAAIFASNGFHLVPALALYLLGMLCLLLGRRNGGGAHVFRGLVGWGGLALVIGIVAVQIPRTFHLEPGSASETFFAVPWLFLVGALSAACIAWPGTARRPPEEVRLPEGHVREVEPAVR